MVFTKTKEEALVNTKTREETVSVIGLGYVGLPLVCLCAEKKYAAFGIDINPQRIESLKKGKCTFHDNNLRGILDKVEFTATADFQVIRDTDIVIVCVPTPIDQNCEPDYRPLKSAFEAIRLYLRRDHLIIIESTINPGACEEFIQPILEKSGLKAGEDFHIAHCPERIDPGNGKWSVRNIPRVLGSTSPKGLQRALAFYRSILEAEVIPMKSINEAAATKIVENTFRDINIAFVNELAKSFTKMGIDVTEVINAASTKPFAFLPHYPGCGVGGDCIPVSPRYLIRQAEKCGFEHKLVKLSREINESMPSYTVNLLLEELNNLKNTNARANIGILGLAYKADVGDTRESPAYKIIELMEKTGANLYVYDPFVLEQSTVKSLDELLDKSEALILTTPHQEFVNMDLGKLKDNGIKIVIDGRNCLDKEKIEKLGIIYRGIGR
jgi:UDP-N-acetyl-D-glucosamine dehydrogenase